MLSSLVLTIAALGVASVASVTAQTCSRNATVEANDTCDSISNKYAVSTYQLALVNADSINVNCTDLEIGQDLCLGWKGEDCSKVYVVLGGDTCAGISSKYGLADGTLSANNPQIDDDCWNIYPGEVLCVDTTAYSYTDDAIASTVAVPTVVATATATSSVTGLPSVTVQQASVASVSATAETGDDDADEDDEDCDEDDEDDDDADDDEDFCDEDDEDCEATDDADLPYCDDL